jgi:hypothetical protein
VSVAELSEFPVPCLAHLPQIAQIGRIPLSDGVESHGRVIGRLAHLSDVHRRLQVRQSVTAGAQGGAQVGQASLTVRVDGAGDGALSLRFVLSIARWIIVPAILSAALLQPIFPRLCIDVDWPERQRHHRANGRLLHVEHGRPASGSSGSEQCGQRSLQRFGVVTCHKVQEM